MSVNRPSQCVFCLFKRPKRVDVPTRRTFHTSSSSRENGSKPIDPTRNLKRRGDWSKHYSPEQVEAIKAAQKLIPRKQFAGGIGPRRHDPWAPRYIDNLSEIDPVVDKHPRAPWENLDDNSRPATSGELEQAARRVAFENPDLMEKLAKLENDEDETTVLDDAEAAQVEKDDEEREKLTVKIFDELMRKMRITTGKDGVELDPPNAMSPSVPSPPKPEKPEKQDPEERKPRQARDRKGEKGGDGKGKKKERDPRDEEEASPALIRLMQMTGYDRARIARLRVKSIIMHNVTNQTRLGKVRRMYVLSIAGNGKGLIGIGEGKAEEVMEAKLQSQYRAIRNMQPIMRYENRTIIGDLDGKVGATELELYARPPGFGLRCQQYIWEICKCAGIYDIAAKVTRARNPMNTVKATVQALLKQKDPEDIARARGKKMVDVRRVYYAGQV